MKFIWFLIVLLLQVNLILSHRIFAKHTSDLLDRLLSNYNKYSRPDPIGEATKVHINLHIRDISYNPRMMTFTLQCILNQWWLDSRLSYWKYFIEEKNRTYLGFDPLELTHKLSSIKLPNQFQLWSPDTVLLNGEPIAKKSNSNSKLIRLHLDGTILLSTKIMFKFKCQMDWTKFPHDVQRCPLHLASFSYLDKEISYRWIYVNPCTVAPKFSLTQLDLIKITCVNKTRKLSQLWINSRKYRSTISLDFYFRRNTSIYIIDVYLPCIILTLTSFCSFFINREATNVRILIGSMTTLSMIILSIENRLLVKSVPYLTAIDYFVMVSFVFIFASIIEFIFVHQHTKTAYGDIGSFSNWLPLDRIAKFVYHALQPKEEVLAPKSPNPLNFNRDDRLAAVVRLSEPMIYDLPITDHLKEDQNSLMNNLLLNGQSCLMNQQTLNSLSLRRSAATTDFIDINSTQSVPNFSTFPRTNHSNNLYSHAETNNSSLISSLINATNGTKTLRRKLASIPEESCAIQPSNSSNGQYQSTNVRLNGNLKLLKQQLEEQQNHQLNQLRNLAAYELEQMHECDVEYGERDDHYEKKCKKSESKFQSSTNRIINYRISEKLNARRLSSNNFFTRIWYECMCSLLKANRQKISGQFDSIHDLNSISEIDQVCRLLFPVLYLLFILSYYLVFVV